MTIEDGCFYIKTGPWGKLAVIAIGGAGERKPDVSSPGGKISENCLFWLEFTDHLCYTKDGMIKREASDGQACSGGRGIP